MAVHFPVPSFSPVFSLTSSRLLALPLPLGLAPVCFLPVYSFSLLQSFFCISPLSFSSLVWWILASSPPPSNGAPFFIEHAPRSVFAVKFLKSALFRLHPCDGIVGCGRYSVDSLLREALKESACSSQRLEAESKRRQVTRPYE